MPLGNYAELQASVADFANRSDLGARIPDFITLAESNINRRLRHLHGEATATGTVSGATLALPAGFQGIRRLTIDLGGRVVEVKPATPQEAESYNSSGLPVKYNINASGIQLLPAAGSTYNYTLLYYQGFSIAATSTNWLLTNHPNVYLFGALHELADFLKDAEETAKYKAKFEEAIGALDVDNMYRRYGPGLAVTRG